MIVDDHPDYPTFSQKAAAPVQYIQLNRNYIWPLGVLRGLMILSLFAGIIAAWCIPYNDPIFYSYDGGFSSTRSALIVLFSIAFGICLIIFGVSLSNFVNLQGVQSVYWLISFCAFDGLWFICLSVTGIVAAVKESELKSFDYVLGIRAGAFGACSFFALFTALLELISILISIPYIRRLKD